MSTQTTERIKRDTVNAWKIADTLRAGDSFHREGVRVVVLRDAEPAPNQFGLPWFRLWCRREDTGAEGYCTFGPGGRVQP